MGQRRPLPLARRPPQPRRAVRSGEGPLAGYLADGQVKECPARVDFVKSDDWSTSFEQGGGGYGYNMAYIGSRLWDTAVTGPLALQQAYARTTSVHEVANPGRR